MTNFKFEVITRPNLEHKISKALRFDDPATLKIITRFFYVYCLDISEEDFKSYVNALALSGAVCSYFYGIEEENVLHYEETKTSTLTTVNSRKRSKGLTEITHISESAGSYYE